jgi:hypothetical protein
MNVAGALRRGARDDALHQSNRGPLGRLVACPRATVIREPADPFEARLVLPNSGEEPWGAEEQGTCHGEEPIPFQMVNGHPGLS